MLHWVYKLVADIVYSLAPGFRMDPTAFPA